MRHLLLVCASVFLPLAALWAQSGNQQKFNVTGSVVNAASGEPVARALVEFRGSEVRTVMTGADGHFELDGLAGGSMSVSARRPGFAPPAQQQQILIDSSTEPIVVRLVPLGKISGTVSDSEGEPIEGIILQCMQEVISNGRKQWQPSNGASTDEGGHFLIEDVTPGSYILRTRETRLYRAQQQRSEAARYIYPAVYYPDAQTRDMALPVVVSPGQEMGVDITLHSIRAARVNFTTVPRYPNVGGTISATDDPSEVTGAQIDASGVFTVVAPPGSWMLAVHGPKQGGEGQIFGELVVDVGRSDIENLKIPIGNLADIPVQVSGGAPTQVFVQLFSRTRPMHGSYVDQSGKMTLPNVTPGTYRVVVHSSDDNTCVTSVMSGSQDLMREDLVVAAGTSVAPIQITESSNCASLTVSANIKTQAILIVTSSLSGFEPRISGISAQGTTYPGFAPGEYKLYAFDDMTDLEYANPDTMRSFKSQTVELEADQKASVQLDVNERRTK